MAGVPHSKKFINSLKIGDKFAEDQEFVTKMDKLASPQAVFLAYFCPLVACLIAHTLYMVLFAMSGVVEMVFFNIGSIIFYAVMIICAKCIKEPLKLVYASIAEIVLHASVATVFVGLRPNFCMFLLMIIPLAFLTPNKVWWAPFVTLLTSVPLYGLLNFYFSTEGRAVYDLSNTNYQTVFYVINIFIGSFVLIYVATIFTYINRYTGSKIRIQNEQLRILASTDPLTKLSNRREINRRLEQVYLESKNSGKSFVVGIGDIDNFKRVNDTYGHDMGDVVLAAVAGTIGNNIPETGCASRWGGEEFLFVLPNTDINGGKECADKIISLIRSQTFTLEDKIFSVTMTVGIYECTSEDSLDNVISRADSRLYKGKHNGKDHTEYTD